MLSTVAFADSLERFDEMALDATGCAPGARDAGARFGAVDAQVRSRGFDGMQAFLSHAERLDDASRRALVADVAGAISVKETYFFRIPRHFELLAGPVLAEIEAARRAQSGRVVGALPLRLWSAACSTGEEPYSAAMALLHGMRYPRAWMPDVLATDLSADAIRIARLGVYDARALTRAPAAWASVLQHHTEKCADGASVRVGDQVRSMVRFGSHNLNLVAPEGDFDVVFCRNVMIYFPFNSQAALVERLYRSLRPGGWLFLGDAELLHVMRHRLETVELGGAIVYRKPGGQPLLDQGGVCVG